MKGETVVINGDRWTVVDVAPAAPLAEMVAALLEEAGLVAMVRGMDLMSDAFSHLGSLSVTTNYVLVPEQQAEEALAVIAETVTDFEGEELEELLARLEAGELPEEFMADPGADDDLDGDLDDDSDADADERQQDDPEDAQGD